MAGGRNARAGGIVAGTGQKGSPRSQGKKEPIYDTKYSIAYFAYNTRRGTLDVRGPDLWRRSHNEQERRPPNDQADADSGSEQRRRQSGRERTEPAPAARVADRH